MGCLLAPSNNGRDRRPLLAVWAVAAGVRSSCVCVRDNRDCLTGSPHLSRRQSTADYFPVIDRAVSSLPDNIGDARQAVYDRARSALLQELYEHDPPLSKLEIARELLALDAAIQRVEAKSYRSQNELMKSETAAGPARRPVFLERQGKNLREIKMVDHKIGELKKPAFWQHHPRLAIELCILCTVIGVIALALSPFRGEPTTFRGEPIECSFEPQADITAQEWLLIKDGHGAYLDHMFYRHPELRKHFPDCEDFEGIPASITPRTPHYNAEKRLPRAQKQLLKIESTAIIVDPAKIFGADARGLDRRGADL